MAQCADKAQDEVEDSEVTSLLVEDVQNLRVTREQVAHDDPTIAALLA